MSTRGAVGIRFGGTDKIGYNHFDSYPCGLGREVLSYLKGKNLDGLKSEFESIECSDDLDEDAWDWTNHCFSMKFDDYLGFMKSSLFNEWSYVINLDDGVLEVYRGFNKSPSAAGRYASLPSEKCCGGYFGVALVKSIPLNELFLGQYVVNDDDEFVKAEE